MSLVKNAELFSRYRSMDLRCKGHPPRLSEVGRRDGADLPRSRFPHQLIIIYDFQRNVDLVYSDGHLRTHWSFLLGKNFSPCSTSGIWTANTSQFTPDVSERVALPAKAENVDVYLVTGRPGVHPSLQN